MQMMMQCFRLLSGSVSVGVDMMQHADDATLSVAVSKLLYLFAQSLQLFQSERHKIQCTDDESPLVLKLRFLCVFCPVQVGTGSS